MPMHLSIAFWFCVVASASSATPGQDEAARDAAGDTLWREARLLTLEGKAFADTESPYDRLPADAKGVVRDRVFELARQSAGLCTRFVTDATRIDARWTLTSEQLAMPHMPATGVSGLDLYVRTETGTWRWLATARPTTFPQNERRLVAGLPAGRREYLLYLPLYNGVTSVEIGVPDGSLLEPGPAREPTARAPIVFYGTSITQGGCASRPGMVHTAILGRRLGRPVVNLGFSGNGTMEVALAELCARIDAAVYVVDCLPNLDPRRVAERVGPFVRALRAARPDTPILLVEDRSYADSHLLAEHRARNEGNRRALRAGYDALVADGVSGLHYLRGSELLGDDGEATVDGSHPTDLGFVRQADAFEKAIRPILARPGRPRGR